MSDEGSQGASAPPVIPNYPIENLWLRDAVAAYNNAARATTMYLGGVGVFIAVCVAPGWDTATVAAGLAGSLGFFGSKDKRAAIEASASSSK